MPPVYSEGNLYKETCINSEGVRVPPVYIVKETCIRKPVSIVTPRDTATPSRVKFPP